MTFLPEAIWQGRTVLGLMTKHASTIRTNPPRLLSVSDAADGSEAVQSYGDLLDEHIEQDQIAKAQKLADEIIGANVDLAG